MDSGISSKDARYRRAPYGARGLKFISIVGDLVDSRRAPYGARGLKYVDFYKLGISVKSRPVWGAWIEITTPRRAPKPWRVAPRMGRVD